MEQTDKPLNEKESLQIIEAMIQTAKQGVSDNGFFYLIWGWAVFIAAISCYLLLTVVGVPEYAGLPWAILMPLCAIITGIYGYRQGKRERVKTHLDHVLGYNFGALGIGLFIVFFFGIKLHMSPYPMVMLVYGTALFVSGGALKFRPLIIGGIINWILAIVSFYMTFEQQLLAISVAVLLGYIIPGHMLQARYKNEAV